MFQSFTTRKMPKDTHNQQAKVKLSELGGKPSQTVSESVSGVEGKVNPGGPGVLGHARLTSRSKETGEMFVMSKSRKQMWDRMKKRVVSTAPLAPAHVKKMKDYMPKGKTYRRGVNKILV